TGLLASIASPSLRCPPTRPQPSLSPPAPTGLAVDLVLGRTRGGAGGSGRLPAPLGLVAGPQEPTVDQVGRAGELAQDRGGVLVAGIVQDPGQELGPFPSWAPSSFGEQEPSPLASGQVPLQQGEDLLPLMCERAAGAAAGSRGGRGHVAAAGQGGVDRPDGGGQ